MKEAQQVVAEKTSSLEAEAYKTKRLQVNRNSGTFDRHKCGFSLLLHTIYFTGRNSSTST